MKSSGIISNVSQVIVVGHGNHFQRMLNTHQFENTEIRRTLFDVGTQTFGELTSIYTPSHTTKPKRPSQEQSIVHCDRER